MYGEGIEREPRRLSKSTDDGRPRAFLFLPQRLTTALRVDWRLPFSAFTK
jgi:hypothetical protein